MRKTQHHIIPFILLLSVIAIPFVGFTQNKDLSQTGAITGKVKDSVYKFVMSSATVAVYKASDSTLLRFTMPNEFGEFTLVPVPVETPLKFVITHVGYKPYIKILRVRKEKPVLDLGWVYMYQNDSTNELKDVVVTSMAPVRMNGDTVEFKADAFKLDSNATAEDLLRKLPGFTVWGDGDITYNGKKITQLLVDGKPFLGGTDFTAATQNLPKDALDKVQVYQQRDEKNPLDSTMFANLKLKEDKSFGHFGKASAGYGTDQRYAMDGMLTGFNTKMQLSGAAGSNNINKMAYNMDMLIKNASYKGVGANTDYQSDFTMGGVNKPLAAGLKFQYDFIPDPQYQKQSRLNADYFFNRNNATNINNTTTNQFLSADSVLTTKSNNSSNTISNNHNLNAAYLFTNMQSNLNLTTQFSSAENHATSQNSSQQLNAGNIVSSNTSGNDNRSNSDNLQLSAEYKHTQQWTGKVLRVPSDFTLKYSFGFTDNTGHGRTLSDFNSTVNPSSDKLYDRLYNKKDSRIFKQNIYAEYPDLATLIFGRTNIGGIRIDLNNTLNLSSGNAATVVSDLDTLTQSYQSDSYLTNYRNWNMVDENPGLSISKYFVKELTNRYSKSFSIILNLKEQYYNFHHTATQTIQNISYNYQKFIPSLSLSYYNHQFGEYEIHTDLNYGAKANYPTVSRMAPLIDSTNLLYLPMGNARLQPEDEKDWSFDFKLNSRRPKNPWEIDVNANYSHIAGAMTDSILYTSSGQQIDYAVNMNSVQNLGGFFTYRKSFETKNNTYRMEVDYNYALNKLPGYTNSVLNLSNSTTNGFRTSVDYAYNDVLTLHEEDGITYYRSVQRGVSNSEFNNNNFYTRFSGALQLPKNLVWSSNVTYNRSVSDNSSPVNYTIWNASLTYRFLHGNRGEIKFAALDLLHQNKGVINKTAGNTQTVGYNNVLQQYFMLTLAYYPRKFGK